MSGGRGSDTYVFHVSEPGIDQVYGFEAWDHVQLLGFGYSSASQALTHITQSGVDVLFSDQNEAITFHNAQLAMFQGAGTVRIS